MASPHSAAQAKLAALRSAFIAQLPGKIQQIEEAWDEAAREGWKGTAAETLHRLLHTLAGTSGTFGLSAVRAAARSMEAELRAVCEGSAIPDERTKDAIGAGLAALRAACKEHDTRPAVEQPAVPLPPSREVSAPPDRNMVFFVEDDLLLIESLAPQIGYYGYDVKTFRTLAAFFEELNRAAPSLIIMDMSLLESGSKGVATVAQVHEGREARIPIVFLSDHGDFEVRLGAVRAGGDAYFIKPVDAGKLADRIDVLTKRKPDQPYRILVVDDEHVLAEFHATILQQAGMTTAVVTDPVQVMREMSDFNPELVLMDVYMPGCNGMELAKVIRQDETYIDIPIVFLSSETDINRQLSAMSRGGDDFLTKPIQPQHLVASVTLRADRHRALRSFMLYDGLTGLLNHARTREELNKEVARASRQSAAALTFAMIDIDHFKSVNDTYGHPIGDQVIKSLARLLKQRLRKTDTVGRFGGEEFAIILADTDGETANKILNELREDFTKIRHQNGGALFSITFSCGAALLLPGSTGAGLIDSADKALYEAKRLGRNRVVFAQAGNDSAMQS